MKSVAILTSADDVADARLHRLSNALIKGGFKVDVCEKGRIATINAISNFLQIPIDHFAEVNLVGFYDLATARQPGVIQGQ